MPKGMANPPGNASYQCGLDERPYPGTGRHAARPDDPDGRYYANCVSSQLWTVSAGLY